MASSSAALRVAVLGYGAIGSTVVSALVNGRVDNAQLSGVITRRPEAVPAGIASLSLDEAIQSSDLVVECASVEAARTEGLRVIEAGVDLLLSSVGALIEEPVRRRLLGGGPGRCLVTSGAMGGLDVLGAASRDGGLANLSLHTSKAPVALVQPWMSPAQREELLHATTPVTLFSGNVVEAIRLFPRSLNVAVALALATGMWEELVVTVVADPEAGLTTHQVTAAGAAGDYEFSLRHRPHPQNPATSGVVPAALLQEIERHAGLRA